MEKFLRKEKDRKLFKIGNKNLLRTCNFKLSQDFTT